MSYEEHGTYDDIELRVTTDGYIVTVTPPMRQRVVYTTKYLWKARLWLWRYKRRVAALERIKK